ncbi:molybdopterin molybdotransferase MoeA [Curvibacter sp. CHRR-16]|uniref:molybdopterin molybdotransferase MoeA n=1 Tax=Curvibacter sp. CHRR-16 TaxID=2835872 RepID=UPI001BD9EE4A|nr:gephyrin-like molybdotransferase Glp [Curvibacter sp. CHRR-16]MBT0571124.1 molybdopterin molybdotransferase MoeA [Curvibacter sp. CHRR-16]
MRALLPLDDVLQRLHDMVQPLGRVQTLPTLQADGRVLAEDVVSPLQVPGFDNSAMDGYALRMADVALASGPASVGLPVLQRVPAGSQPQSLQPGSAARIFTGAAIPPGADVVVMQEHCTLEERADQPSLLRLPEAGSPSAARLGNNIRRAGEDVAHNAVVLSAGQRLTPAALGLAASVGRASLQVAARPRVALFTTGDELIMPGAVAPHDLPAGAIYNSNRFVLHSLLQRLGCEVTDLGIVPDTLAATQDALRAAVAGHDLVLTSGGVSVGEEDHLRAAVLSMGTVDVWQIAIKPGKPFAFGRLQHAGQQAWFAGLPGNPVASLVTCLLLVRPLLLRLQGSMESALDATKFIAAPAHFMRSTADKRREFLRVRRSAEGGLELFPSQSSGVLTSTVWGDGLVDVPAGQTVEHGQLVPYLSFASLWA